MNKTAAVEEYFYIKKDFFLLKKKKKKKKKKEETRWRFKWRRKWSVSDREARPTSRPQQQQQQRAIAALLLLLEKCPAAAATAALEVIHYSRAAAVCHCLVLFLLVTCASSPSTHPSTHPLARSLDDQMTTTTRRRHVETISYLYRTSVGRSVVYRRVCNHKDSIAIKPPPFPFLLCFYTPATTTFLPSFFSFFSFFFFFFSTYVRRLQLNNDQPVVDPSESVKMVATDADAIHLTNCVKN